MISLVIFSFSVAGFVALLLSQISIGLERISKGEYHLVLTALTLGVIFVLIALRIIQLVHLNLMMC